MILISHRGNINGKNEIRENSIFYIMEALSMGFDVEIDVWNVDKFNLLKSSSIIISVVASL